VINFTNTLDWHNTSICKAGQALLKRRQSHVRDNPEEHKTLTTGKVKSATNKSSVMSNL